MSIQLNYIPWERLAWILVRMCESVAVLRPTFKSCVLIRVKMEREVWATQIQEIYSRSSLRSMVILIVFANGTNWTQSLPDINTAPWALGEDKRDLGWGNVCSDINSSWIKLFNLSQKKLRIADLEIWGHLWLTPTFYWRNRCRKTGSPDKQMSGREKVPGLPKVIPRPSFSGFIIIVSRQCSNTLHFVFFFLFFETCN